jgi:hypothetical protein
MRSLTLSLSWGLAALGVSAPLAAQDATLNALLFERSYAAVGTPDVLGAPGYYAGVAEPDLLAEAQIAPHLTLRRGLVLDEIKYGAGHGLNLFLTPQLRLRGYDVVSGPVKSLSFMPKFTLQWLWAGGQDDDDSLAPGPRHVRGFHFALGHHSNGGSTCEFRDQVLDSEGRCVYGGGGAEPDPSVREAWVEGGNFSTNYVELGGGYRYGVTASQPVEHWRWFAEGAVSVQHHHTWFGLPLPGGADPAFGALYGLTRLRIDASGHHMLDMLGSRFALRANVRVDRWSAEAERFAGARNHTLESDLYVQYVPNIRDALPGILGLGVRYARGQDYYNTQYVRDISHFQLALFLDLWSPIFE